MATTQRTSDRPEPRRVRFELTPEQRAYLEKAREEEVSNRDHAAEDVKWTRAAAEEATFSGRLRNAIHRAPLLLDDLCQRSNVDISLLGDFLRGEATLDSSSVDRLIAVIGWKAVETAESPLIRANRTSEAHHTG
jgi:hypothetical protein